MSVSARTVAERGSPSSKLISPKNWPGPMRPRLRRVTSTVAAPSRMKKNSSPGSPTRVSIVPVGTSTTREIAATAFNCFFVQSAKRSTFCR